MCVRLEFASDQFVGIVSQPVAKTEKEYEDVSDLVGDLGAKSHRRPPVRRMPADQMRQLPGLAANCQDQRRKGMVAVPTPRAAELAHRSHKLAHGYRIDTSQTGSSRSLVENRRVISSHQA